VSSKEWEPLAEREEEFSFVSAEFEIMEEGTKQFEGGNVGFMCHASTDEKLQATSLWERYISYLEPNYGETRVWSWPVDSGILPCQVYTRHCVLAVQEEGVPSYVTDSFLDETFLRDQKTTLREHLAANPALMDTPPPDAFAERYSG